MDDAQQETGTPATAPAASVPQARPSLEVERAQMAWAVDSLLTTGSSRADAAGEWWD